MNQDPIQINDALLVKYLLGEADADEHSFVEDWASESPEHARQLEDFRKILNASKYQVDESLDEYAALEKLNMRIAKAKNTPVFRFRPLLRLAAMLAVVVSTGWFLYTNTIGSNIAVSTTGDTLTQNLPDGSTAILNRQSALTFKGGIFNKTREVTLKGEAFFKVSPDKSKPFIIDVNGISVTVVGTSFNVKSDGNATTVIVESGIVKVGNQTSNVRLTAGEKAEVKANKLLKGHNQGKLYNYYYTDVLVCDGTPLDELVEVLNKKFNSNIVIANRDIQKLPISTTFKNDSLKEILAVVAETFNIKVEYKQGTITLK